MNPINRELTEYRNAIEHYERILKEDSLIKNGEYESDNPLLSAEDITRINQKLSILREQRDDLLSKEKDYTEIL